MFVVGDIEDSEISFNDALECIDIYIRKNPSLKLLFLGDIYTPKNPNLSIKKIDLLFKHLGIQIYNFIDEFLTQTSDIYNLCMIVKNKFTSLYQYLDIDVYTVMNRFKCNEKIDDILKKDSTNKNNIIFLLGNKEVDLIRDLNNVSSMNYVDGKFILNFSYFNKKNKYEISISFTPYEINILMNYLIRCSHFYQLNSILLTHIYINGRSLIKFNKIFNIDRVIAGHNRCFGRYFDKDLKDVDIYILDISHEKPNLLKNYIYIQNNSIYFFPIDKFVEKCLPFKLSANRTFLRGGWEAGNHVGTVDFYRSIFSEDL